PKSDQARDPGSGKVTLYPTNYGFNYGTWFVFDPTNGNGGNGAFFPNASLTIAAFTDGTSNTLLASEVKSWQPYTRNGGPSTTTIPSTASEAATITASGGQFKTNTGHTEWPDGRVHHTGFTVTMNPNTHVPYTNAGTEYNADYNSWQEGKNGGAGSPTYAIITSRSHHIGVVNAVLVDGSVRTISENISLDIWRALGTRQNGEVLGEF
ncbi:MAG: DUF1559 domain-containing protein, partial [Gimesia sp.]|nr:DUF1559 domain-containing protein [Gimesia sp.]